MIATAAALAAGLIAALFINHSLRAPLVEDNDVNLMVFGEIRRAAGHEVVVAAERERFDAELMDISTPVMNGVEAARAIHCGDEPNRQTPIIGLTAQTRPRNWRTLRRAASGPASPNRSSAAISIAGSPRWLPPGTAPRESLQSLQMIRRRRIRSSMTRAPRNSPYALTRHG